MAMPDDAEPVHPDGPLRDLVADWRERADTDDPLRELFPDKWSRAADELEDRLDRYAHE